MTGKRPLQIISVVNKKIVFHQENLDSVLEKCGERPLVIYTVAGKFREGKSFLLNLLLLYNEHKNADNEQWMEEPQLITGKNI